VSRTTWSSGSFLLGPVLLLAGAAGLAAGARGASLEPGDSWGLEGFFQPERDPRGSIYAWSRPRALVHFRGMDRRRGTRVELELRSWRPPGLAAPTVAIQADGRIIWQRPLEAGWQIVELGLGPEPAEHLDLVIATEGFRPSDTVARSEDRRTLGVELRRARVKTGGDWLRRLAWAALSLLVAAAGWTLLSRLGVAAAVRSCWALAAALGTNWVAVAIARRYLWDAAPPWATPAARLMMLALLFSPLLLSRRWGEPGRKPPQGTLALAAIAGSVFAVYSPALGHGFFWDDFHLTQPLTLGQWLMTFGDTWDSLGMATVDYYRPLVTTLFQIDLALYGLRPAGFHLTNILLHIFNSFLLFLFLSRWVRRRWALAGAAFFALHPMASTAVTWISQRTDVLCASFYALALLGAASYLRHPHRTRGALMSGLSYAASLASKEMGISFPAVALVYAVARRRLGPQLVKLFALLAAISVSYTALWLSLFSSKLRQSNLLRHAAEAPAGELWNALRRLLALALTPAYYASHDMERLAGESQAYLYLGSAVFLLGGAAVAGWGRRRESVLYGLGGAWLVLTVIPLFNLRYVDFLRLGYLPAMGAGLAAAATGSFVSRAAAGRWLAAALLLLGLNRSMEIDRLVIADWGPGGQMVELITRYEENDPHWQARIGPQRLAIFEEQTARVRQEKEHVQVLLGGETGHPGPH